MKETWWPIEGDVVTQCFRTWWLNGSSLDVKSALLGSNPASLQPAGTCQFLAGI